MPTFTIEVDGRTVVLDAPDQDTAVSAAVQAVRGGNGAPAPEQPGLLRRAANQALDVARSAGTGLAEGAIGLVGLPGTVREGVNWAVEQGMRRAFGVEPAPPEEVRRNNGMLDALMVPPPSARQITQAVQGVTGEFYRPQTTAGEYARTVAEFVPGAAAFGVPGLARLGATNLAVNAVAPGVASEAAGQLTRGTSFEPAARIAAGFAGGVGANMLPGVRPNYATQLAGQAAREVTPQEWAAARQLLDDASARGVQLTLDEAIQTVTGGATRMNDVRRVLDQTAGGGEIMRRAMADRNPALERVAREGVDQIAPPAVTPSAIGPQAQRAAETAIDRMRQAGNQIAEPFYDALRGQTMPAAEYARISQNPSYQEALRQFRSNRELSAPYAGLGDDNLAVVNQVVQQLDTLVQAARPGIGNQQNANRTLEGLRQGARSEADQAGIAASREWEQAREIVRDWRRRYVDPLQAGPLGGIAATDDVTAQTARLTREIPNAEGEITQAIGLLRGTGQQGEEAARGLARLRIEQDINNRFGATNRGQVDDFAGARFAGDIRGDVQRGRNVDAMVRATAGQSIGDEFQRRIDILAATGARPQPGSATTFNTLLSGAMQQGGPWNWFSGVRQNIRDQYQQARLQATSTDLARLLLAGPQGLNTLQRTANTELLRQLLLRNLGTTATAQTSP